MRSIDLEWFKTSDKVPSELDTQDSIDCLVLRNYKHSNGKEYQTIEHLVFNSYYNSWDDSTGDDNECELNDVMAWCLMPNIDNIIDSIK